MVDGDITLGFAKRAAHAMSALVVQAVVETFAQDTPLEGVVLAISGVLIAVYAPAGRDVVEYQMVAVAYRHGIGAAGPRFVFVAQAHADVADYDVGGFADAEFVILDRDAVARGGLPGDGEPFVSDSDLRFELDSARDLEDYGARAFGRVDPIAKRPWARVVYVGYVIDVSSAPTLGVSSVAFGAGERQGQAFAEPVNLFSSRGEFGLTCIAPEIVIQRATDLVTVGASLIVHFD